MPVTNLYASAEVLASRAPALFADTEGGLDESKRDVAESLLEAISRAIDARTHRAEGAFSPSPAQPTERVVYGTGEPVLLLPEFVPGSQVAVAAPDDLPEAWREYRRGGQLGLHTATTDGILTRDVPWTRDVPYSVTTRYGVAVIPPPIVEACLIWSAQRARMNSGDVSGVVTTIIRDGATLQRDGVPPVVDELLKSFVIDEPTSGHDSEISVGRLSDSDTYSGSW